MKLLLSSYKTNFWKFFLIALIVYIGPKIIIGFLMLLLPEQSSTIMTSSERQVNNPFFPNVIAYPLLESILLGFLLVFLNKFSKNRIFTSISAGLIWGTLHLSNSLANGIFASWGFFVMSYAYQFWLQAHPGGRRIFGKLDSNGFALIVIMHMTNNFIVWIPQVFRVASTAA